MKTMTKDLRFSRIVAFVLSLIVLLGSVDLNTIFDVLAENDAFSIVVKDTIDNPIEGATVTVSAETNTQDETGESESGEIGEAQSWTATTDESGKATFDDVETYLSSNGLESLNIIYTVTKDGYKDAGITEYVSIKSGSSVDVVLKDTKAPVISAISGNPTEWTTGSVTLSIETEDKDVASYSILKDNEWVEQKENAFVVYSNGKYTFSIKDLSDNTSERFSVDVTKFDKTAPVISNISDIMDNNEIQAVGFEVTATDNESGIKEYGISKDGGEIQWQESNRFYIDSAAIYSFYAKDNVGNISDAVEKSTENYDFEVPVIDSVKAENDNWSNTSIDYIVSVKNAGDNFEYYILTESLANSINKDLSLREYNEAVYKLLKDNDIVGNTSNAFAISDTNIYAFIVRDDAGNYSKPFIMESPAKIDKTAPDEIKYELIDASEAKIEVSASDKGDIENHASGISQYAILYGQDIEGKSEEDIIALLTWQNDKVFEINKDDNTFILYIRDNAGNIGSKQFTVEPTTDSNIKITLTPDNNSWTNDENGIKYNIRIDRAMNWLESGKNFIDTNSVYIQYYIVEYTGVEPDLDPESIEWKKIVKESWAGLINPYYSATENMKEAKLYSIYVEDMNGNTCKYTLESLPKVDRTNPTIDSVTKDIEGDVATDEPVTITVTASDMGDVENHASGVVEYAMLTDDEEYKNSNDILAALSSKWQKDNVFKVRANDTYVFYVRDAAGNISERIELVVKNFRPEITIRPESNKDGMQTIGFNVVSNNDIAIKEYGMSKDEGEIQWQANSKFYIYSNGTYHFYAKGEDGNISDPIDKIVDDYDGEAPVIDSVTITSENWTNESIEYVLNASNADGYYWYFMIETSLIKDIDQELSIHEYNDAIFDLLYKEKGQLREYVEAKTSNSFIVSEAVLYSFIVRDGSGNYSIIYNMEELPLIDKTKPAIDEITYSDELTKDAIGITVTASDIGDVENHASGVIGYAILTKTEIEGKDEAEIKALLQDKWQIENVFSIVGNDTYVFYVIDAAGNISDQKDVTIENYDSLAPNEIKAEFIRQNDILEILNNITFGHYFNEYVTINVYAADPTDEKNAASGLLDCEFIFVNNSGVIEKTQKVEFVINENEKAVATLALNRDFVENFEGTIKIIVSDKVGNTTEELDVIKVSDEIIIDEDNADVILIENDAPSINIVSPENETIKNGVFDFEFNIDDVIDGYFYSGINKVFIEVNDTSINDEFSNEYLSGKVGAKDYVIKVDSINKTVNGISIADDWNMGVLTFKVSALDNSGNMSKTETLKIYIDQTAPEITKFDFNLENNIDEEITILNAIEELKYGFYFKENVVVTITAFDSCADDETKAAGVKTITYKLVDVDGNIVSENTQEAIDGVVSFVVEKNFKGMIYAYATDTIGNQPEINEATFDGYVRPHGVIKEDLDKHSETSNISITVPEKVGTQNNSYSFDYTGNGIIDAIKDYDDTQKVPLYNSANGVTVKVDVKDTFSGIRNVKYTIISGEMNNRTTVVKELNIDNDGNLSDDSNWTVIGNNDTDNLVYHIQGEFVVEGKNNIVILVELTDRAGNTSYDYYVIGIDNVAPVIEVTYDDNVALNDDENIEFFRTDRNAIIRIFERNFDPKNVKVTITKDGREINLVDLTSPIQWTVAVDENNSDNTVYTAKIAYTSDGDYTFDISFVDNAKNVNDGVNYGESIAPRKFTIDKTLPVLTVEYDNNSARNGNYYKADRIATITIVEHNFDPSRVNITGRKGLDNGWSSNGDTHVATISYTQDGVYSFDIAVTDMAGNIVDDFDEQNFVIDKTVPTLTIEGIVDKSSSNNEGNIGFVITAIDVNLDEFVPKVQGVVMENATFTTKVINLGNAESVENGKKYTITNVESDGIYGITCTVVDKAGNKYKEVILEDSTGGEYKEQRSGSDELISFAVNRNGSTFTVDSYTQGILDTYYVNNVTESLVIYETNADKIVERKITVNGKELVENTDYTVREESGSGSWYKYAYSINKSVFTAEAEYEIVIYSKDNATNEAFSDIKDLDVKFVVDRTAPVITVVGLEDDGRYQVEKKKVTVIPTDDGGMLKSLVVRTVDEDGKVIKELINLTGDALLDAIAAGEIEFVLNEGLYQNVQIICEDYAGNISGDSDKEIYKNISVSSNALKLFWANKPLRWGVIGGISLLLIAVIVIIILKKKKNNKQEA